MDSRGLPCKPPWACPVSRILNACPSPGLATSILHFLLSSLVKHSSITLRLLPVGSASSAFWKVGASAEFSGIRDVEMAFTLLIHLENKIQLRLSTFKEITFSRSKVLALKLAEHGGLVKLHDRVGWFGIWDKMEQYASPSNEGAQEQV